MRKGWKKAVVGLLVLVLAVGGYFGYTRYEAAQKAEAAKTLSLSGNVDLREVSLAFRESDRIADILVDEGDTVKAGDELAHLDTRELTLAIRKTEAQIAAQQATVEKLHNGTRAEEIEQAEQTYRSARAAAEQAQGDYARMQQIYDDIRGISEQELETAQKNAEAKAASAEAAAQKWREAVNGARSEDVAIGEANLQALEDELARQNYLLSQYTLTAPADGVVRSRLLEPGAMASPQAPVLKLSLTGRKWVRVYVKETDLGKIYEGQGAKIYIDSQSEPLEGQVGYISSTAEFTPKNVQTDELRTALVYEVRIYTDDTGNVLRLGMPATVKISL